MTACTWISSKWSDPAFGSRAVVRCFVGAVGDEDILEAMDADLIEACSKHLSAVVALPERPEDAAVVRWPRSMPQYELGHLDRVERDPRGRCPRVSSWWAPPTTAWASPIACARRVRRPTGSSNTSPATLDKETAR